MKIRVHRAVWETSEFDVKGSVESIRQDWEYLHGAAINNSREEVSTGESVGISEEVQIIDDSGKTLATFDAESGQDIVGQPGPVIRIDLDIAQHIVATYPRILSTSDVVNRILRQHFESGRA